MSRSRFKNSFYLFSLQNVNSSNHSLIFVVEHGSSFGYFDNLSDIHPLQAAQDSKDLNCHQPSKRYASNRQLPYLVDKFDNCNSLYPFDETHIQKVENTINTNPLVSTVPISNRSSYQSVASEIQGMFRFQPAVRRT